MKIWSISDTNKEKRYCLYLCQSEEGNRYFQLAETESHFIPENAFAKTKTIDNEILMKRNLITISKNFTLTNNENFYVDPHGMWITQHESDQLNNGVDFFEVKWDTESAPNMASR